MFLNANFFIVEPINYIVDMKKSLVLLFVTLSILVVFVQSGKKIKKQLQEPVTVPYVNLKKYLGVWYEIASIPTDFAKGCSNTFATYSLNDDKKSIKVNNTCTRNGKKSSTIGKATPDDCTNSKLTVKFGPSPNSGGQYWIVRLGQDYDYVVVSNSDYSYLWILYREKQMPKDLYDSIICDLRNDNFPVQKLVKQDQSQ